MMGSLYPGSLNWDEPRSQTWRELDTVRLLVPGHFYFYAVSKFLLRENDISVLLL